jgi:spermidine synthase
MLKKDRHDKNKIKKQHYVPQIDKQSGNMQKSGRRLFFIIFIASGFAGLLYESIWTHYLKLFLGHAAYAQTLVLAVFMGGMALGSWFSARYSKRWSNLLLGYAIVEAIIGVFAMVFHPLYVQFLDLAYTRLIPEIGSPTAITFFKWITASFFILPQSILLGMTFPMLTAGLIRKYPENPGSTIAMLYFSNSIGAAAGVLASGFMFIALAGLPGTLIIAGLINIGVAAIVWHKVRDDKSFAERNRKTAVQPDVNTTSTYRILLTVALLTGTSSLIYELGWIRMLNLVLSSSTHAFELMLSAFITGLALGGLWIRRRIEGLQQPIRFLAFVQIAMGLLALATLPLYGKTFEVMAWLVGNLERSMIGYTIFNVISHSMALAIMLPATFCAGMTLPLITAILLRDGYGEKSIGATYAFNTVGCIIGIFLAVHLVMPILGLKGMLGLGAGIDIALGLALAWWAFPARRIPAILTAMSTAILLFSMIWIQFDTRNMSSGVYRTGQLFRAGEEEVLFHHDGKTSTVSVVKYRDGVLSIATNGKPDASINVIQEAVSGDESNQILLGAMPLVFHPHAKTAAVIGWGSGMTTDILLTTAQLDRVDSVEIEPTMVKAAMFFRPRVELAYTDPRSHIHIEDAKTFFSTYNKKYDIIVSEPSNPWVSGVAGLFSKEFYLRIKDHLNKDGLMVQWLHLYQIDMPLVASIFEALSSQFADYAVYSTNEADIVILARPAGAVPEPDPGVIREKGLSYELRRMGINGPQDLIVRRVGNKRALEPLFESYGVEANSDYYPLLDLNAARARFMRTTATDLVTANAHLTLLPVMEMLGQYPSNLNTTEVSYSNFDRSKKIYVSALLNEYILHGLWKWEHPDTRLSENFRKYADMVRQSLSDCSDKTHDEKWWDGMLFLVTRQILPIRSPNQLGKLWEKADSSCRAQLSTSQRDFITLLKAIDKRDSPSMAQTALKLLEEMPGASSALRSYILATGMLGDISNGEKRAAQALWEQYGKRLDAKDSQTLLMRLLTAHAKLAN